MEKEKNKLDSADLIGKLIGRQAVKPLGPLMGCNLQGKNELDFVPSKINHRAH